MDSNHRPHAYQACALTRLSYRPRFHAPAGAGGPDRDRTDDLLDANQALSQLSYGPHIHGSDTSVGGRFQSIAMLSHDSHSPFGSRRLDLLDANQALSQLSYGPHIRPSTLVKDSTSVFKNRIEISIGSVDLSSLLDPRRADARGSDSP